MVFYYCNKILYIVKTVYNETTGKQIKEYTIKQKVYAIKYI